MGYALNGSSNTVVVTEIGAILINGTKNKVSWKKAKSGKKPSSSANPQRIRPSS